METITLRLPLRARSCPMASARSELDYADCSILDLRAAA